jgi:AcrR family transcriptional regulator
MKTPKTPVTNDEKPLPTRRPGRRPKSEDGTPAPSREAVIQCAVDLARKEPISEVSMVRVARELGVAAGLVHYYLGSRDDLLSAVINFAFKERVDALPEPSGDWRADLEGVARSALVVLARWPGLGAYLMTRNRFRLFQRVQPGETDYGLAYFDHIGQVLRSAGFPGAKAALVFHLLMLFITSIAVERENRQAPGMHEEFIVGYVSKFDRSTVPGAAFLAGPFGKIDNDTTFETGLRILLDGFEAWRTASAPPKVVQRVRAAR